MPARPRAPWWIYACAAVFLGYFLLNFGYFSFFGWRSIGFDLDPLAAEGNVIRRVQVGGPTDAAGLRPGDRLVSLGGYRIRNILDHLVAQWNLDCSAPVPVEITRDGATIHTALVIPRGYTALPSVQSAARLMWTVVSMIQLALAFVVVFSRPRDPSALLGGLFLAAFACEFNPVVTGAALTWRQFPWLLQVAFFVPDVVSNGAWWFLAFLFFTVFPRRVFSRVLPRVLVCVPAAVVIVAGAAAK